MTQSLLTKALDGSKKTTQQRTGSTPKKAQYRNTERTGTYLSISINKMVGSHCLPVRTVPVPGEAGDFDFKQCFKSVLIFLRIQHTAWIGIQNFSYPTEL